MSNKKNISVCFTADQFKKYADGKSTVVVIDLLRVGVPSIELLDLAGLENKVGAADCYYDNLNRLIFRMRHNGIVLGATNEDEFINEMNKIVDNLEFLIKKINKALLNKY